MSATNDTQEQPHNWRFVRLTEERDKFEARCAVLATALERIEALRTNEHAAGFDEAREIAAEALAAAPTREEGAWDDVPDEAAEAYMRYREREESSRGVTLTEEQAGDVALVILEALPNPEGQMHEHGAWWLASKRALALLRGEEPR